jgi:mRNA interferase RelE/StbE
MRIKLSRGFKRTVKRLRANQKKDLDDAVRTIAADPTTGEAKVGDLAGVRVHKFPMAKQRVLLAYTLLAYTWDDDSLVLLALGGHENYYRGLKRQGD